MASLHLQTLTIRQLHSTLSMAANQVAVGAFRRAVNNTFLDTQPLYGVYCHMPKAKLVLHTRYVDEQGGLVEMKVYDVPKTPSTPYGFNYSLVYILKGQRLVGYDNHEHKGDHRHFRATTTPYIFTTVDRLIEDFRRDVTAVKKETGR